MNHPSINRPQTTVVLAISVDGKIADRQSNGKLGSDADSAHLERQVAAADAVLLGAGTLRAEQTGVCVRTPQLLAKRRDQGMPPQPVHIICTRSGQMDRNLKFFEQPLPRWLLTTTVGAQDWQPSPEYFERILSFGESKDELNWHQALTRMAELGIKKLAVIGGGEIVAALLAENVIDELYLTLCPLILGGAESHGAVAGQGFVLPDVPHLALLNVQQVGQELFLHYRVQR